MAYTNKQLRAIWKATEGRCHLTGRRLKLKEYGRTWEVDHSKPRARGGSDHGNNLRPALISANRSKQARSSRAARARHGLTRAPMSTVEQARRRNRHAAVGVAAGAATGALFGPAGAFIGGVLGGIIGHSKDVE